MSDLYLQATMVIPGAHKSNIDYRTVLERPDGPGSMGGVLGAVELHLQPGDVLLFVDCLTHGAARRTNPVRNFARVGFAAEISPAMCMLT